MSVYVCVCYKYITLNTRLIIPCQNHFGILRTGARTTHQFPGRSSCLCLFHAPSPCASQA